MRALQTQQIGSISSDQIVNLTTDQIAALGSQQLRSISTRAITALSSEQVFSLSSNALQQLTTLQINALTQWQLSTGRHRPDCPTQHAASEFAGHRLARHAEQRPVCGARNARPGLDVEPPDRRADAETQLLGHDHRPGALAAQQ
jgi:hypothetical protein